MKYLINKSIKEIEKKYKDYKPIKLQELWTSTELNTDLFDFLDEVGEHFNNIMNVAYFEEVEPSLLVLIADDNNKKLIKNYKSIVAGMYLLSSLNTKILNQ